MLTFRAKSDTVTHVVESGALSQLHCFQWKLRGAVHACHRSVRGFGLPCSTLCSIFVLEPSSILISIYSSSGLYRTVLFCTQLRMSCVPIRSHPATRPELTSPSRVRFRALSAGRGPKQAKSMEHSQQTTIGLPSLDQALGLVKKLRHNKGWICEAEGCSETRLVAEVGFFPLPASLLDVLMTSTRYQDVLCHIYEQHLQAELPSEFSQFRCRYCEYKALRIRVRSFSRLPSINGSTHVVMLA